MGDDHISDETLERYCLGMIVAEAELAPLEEHLLTCASCVDRMEEEQRYIDTMRAALTELRGACYGFE